MTVNTGSQKEIFVELLLRGDLLFGVVGFRVGPCIVSDVAARDRSQPAFADRTNLPTNTPAATHLEMSKRDELPLNYQRETHSTARSSQISKWLF